MDIQKDICVIPFQMQVYFPRFSSPHSAALLKEHFTKRGRGQQSCFRSEVALIYSFVVASRGIMVHCLLKKPLCPLSNVPIIEPLHQRAAHQHQFQQTEWALRFQLARERRKAGTYRHLRPCVSEDVNLTQPSGPFGNTQSWAKRSPAAMLKVFDKELLRKSC